MMAIDALASGCEPSHAATPSPQSTRKVASPVVDITGCDIEVFIAWLQARHDRVAAAARPAALTRGEFETEEDFAARERAVASAALKDAAAVPSEFASTVFHFQCAIHLAKYDLDNGCFPGTFGRTHTLNEYGRSTDPYVKPRPHGSGLSSSFLSTFDEFAGQPRVGDGSCNGGPGRTFSWSSTSVTESGGLPLTARFWICADPNAREGDGGSVSMDINTGPICLSVDDAKQLRAASDANLLAIDANLRFSPDEPGYTVVGRLVTLGR